MKKGNKLYSTKEMKADSFEPSVSDVKEATQINTKYTIEEKRGRYIVKDINGIRVGIFNKRSDADNFISQK